MFVLAQKALDGQAAMEHLPSRQDGNCSGYAALPGMAVPTLDSALHNVLLSS